MRYLIAIAVLLGTMLAVPAYALDVDHLLKQTFGSSDPRDLGLPLFVLIGIVAGLFFWGALRIGRKRQRRMIESYDSQLQDYSARLRRGKS